MSILSVLYIVIITICMSVQNVARKGYNNVLDGRGAYIFSAVSVFVSLVFFIVRSRLNFVFEISALPYVIGFSLTYCMAVLFNFFALQCGPLSLTSLVLSYSLLIPTFYGLVFDSDDVKISFYIGLCFLAVSLFFINDNTDSGKITFKWVVCALLSLLGNGLCSTFQTVQQRVFEQKYQNEFMILSLLFVSIVLFVFAILQEKKDAVICAKKGIFYMILCGVANAVVNVLVMVLSSVVNKSLMFPLISAGGIVITWFVAVHLYRERLTKKQNFAILLGIIAIVFLNI